MRVAARGADSSDFDPSGQTNGTPRWFIPVNDGIAPGRAPLPTTIGAPFMKRFAVILALLVLTLPTFAQEQVLAQAPQYGERIDVNAVLLDVIVTDRKGNHILGLGPDDFIVKENGVEQTIDSVDYFTNRRLLDQREEQAVFKVERVRD